jgi:tripartite-type tricarboxylate transporter receptor subunit TctC
MKSYGVAVLFLVLFLFTTGPVHGQSDFPNKPINLIMVQPAGGSADLNARLIARLAEKHLGQPVVVVNKPGGSGTIGTAAIAAAKPDGYTIGTLGNSPVVMVPHMTKLSYDPLKDFDPILQFGVNNWAISVRYDSPYKTLKEVVDYARENPGVLTYGTGGPFSSTHIAMFMVTKESKVEMVHVPFKGGPESLTAVMGGHITLAVGDFSAQLVKAKKMRVLAMILDERWPDFPDIPTLKELGYSTTFPFFIGLGGPKGLPEPVIKRLEDAFTKATQDPEFAPGMRAIGVPVYYRNRKDFTAFITKSYEQMGDIIQEMMKK